MADDPPSSLTEMFERIDQAAAARDRVSLQQILQNLGNRSFAPLLLLAGVLALAFGGIPGVPTAVAILVALIAGQLLLHRESFWMPRWLIHRSIASRHVHQVVHLVRRPARWLDRWMRPRWTALTRTAGTHAIAGLSLLIAAALPPMELVPFSSHSTGAALTAFALALTTHDGLMGVIGVLLTGVTFGIVGYAVVAGF